MPSFDIVSKPNIAEIDNALNGLKREISTRFDFKGSHCTIERKDEKQIEIHADDELKLKQVQELLKMHLTRRGVETTFLEFLDSQKAAGQSVRQSVTIKQGIAHDLAKTIISHIKESKIKVQSAIQGDELRITGKKKDDLQEVMALLKRLNLSQPLQFTNFRD